MSALIAVHGIRGLAFAAAHGMRVQPFDISIDRLFDSLRRQTGEFIVFGNKVHALPSEMAAVRRRRQHQLAPCQPILVDQRAMRFGLNERISIAFVRTEVLHAGNRGVHFHRGKPVAHHRIGLPPAVITLFAKTEILGRDGRGFMARITGSAASRAFSGNRYAEVECFPGFGTRSEKLDDLCGFDAHDSTAGQAGWGTRGMVMAAGTLGSIAAAAARVPALTTLATAATARKRRRVGSRGGNIMGWSIADVFVGGVLSTLSAWVIWNCGPFWLGLEPGRKLQLPLGLQLCYQGIMEKTTVIAKKKRGPPPTGKGEPVVVRMQPALLAVLDGWIAGQKPPFPSRPEAVRRLVELGLRVKK